MRIFKKIINVFSSILLVIFILFAVLLVGVRLVGIEPYIVLSGSMEPEIHTGALIYVDKITPEEACNLKVGDTVTYLINNSGTRVNHKFYEVVGPLYVQDTDGSLLLDENGNPTAATDDRGYPIIMYTTYGINNTNAESPTGYTLDGTLGVGNLASSNVVGKPAFVVPYLGYVAHFVQNPPGKYFTLLICALLVFNTFFGSSGKKPKKTEGEDSPSEADGTPDTPPSPAPDTAVVPTPNAAEATTPKE